MMLDEPFAGVDPIAVHDIQTIVAGLRHRGIGVLISDHNVEQTLDIVDRAYIMFDGQVKVGGSVLKSSPVDGRVARGASRNMSRWSLGSAMMESNVALPEATIVNGRMTLSVPFQ